MIISQKSKIMRMRGFFSTSAETDVVFILPTNYYLSLYFRCKMSHFIWLISRNHAHQKLFQYFSSNGCCLHFTHTSLPEAVLCLQDESGHDASFRARSVIFDITRISLNKQDTVL